MADTRSWNDNVIRLLELIRDAASGGGVASAVKIKNPSDVEMGDAAVPVRVDPTGTTTQPVKQTSTTATTANVASSASNVTLLASNAARLGATIYNDSTKILYLKLGATASATSFTTQLAKDSYFEVPFGYTGIIDGVWSAVNGSARITELT